MALIKINSIADDVQLGLWKIEESCDDFFIRYPFLEDYKAMLDKKACESRKLEFLAIRALLYEMTKDVFLEIRHDERGKPVLRGYHISISHTKGWAALILSKNKSVGVDIEYISDRVSKVKDKFLRADEEAPDVQSQLVIWSVKETMYKLFSEDDLEYSQMRVFQIKDGYSMVINYKRYMSVPVQYEVNQDFVLTFAFC